MISDENSFRYTYNHKIIIIRFFVSPVLMPKISNDDTSNPSAKGQVISAGIRVRVSECENMEERPKQTDAF